MKQNIIKVITIIIAIILVADMALFAMKKTSQIVFWLVLIIGAIMAFLVIPRLNKKAS